MTYSYSYTPSTYEVTAFSEDALGSDIGCGSTFTMPSYADLCITVKDDDRYLSGDSCYNENSDDRSYQTAKILQDDTEVGNGGQIYAEKYYWVKDQDGNWYVMIEIEQEGTNEDYFTFYTGGDYDVPPAGAELTVHSSCNVSSNWLKYDQLGAGDCAPPTGSISGTVFCDTDCDGVNGGFTVVPGCDYVVEAESMYDCGFKTVSGDQASGGKLVKLECNSGSLKTYFDGKAGTYDFRLTAQDECDGQSKIYVKVNGVLIDVIKLDRDTDGGGSNNGSFSDFVITGLELKPGDKVELFAYSDGYEFVRIDKIAFEGQDQVEYTPEPVKEGVVIKLVDLDGNVIAETTTDADGNYSFTGVPVGDYKIMGVAPDGTEFTIQDVDGNSKDDIDSDVGADGMSGVISVAAGESYDVDLGVCDKPEPGALSGRYFCDTDNDDVDDGQAVDPGVAGVLVTLLDAAGNVVATTFTGPEGQYLFTGLDAGTYSVEFTDPDGVLAGKQLVDANVGSDDAIDSDAIGDTTLSAITGIEVVAGGEAKDNDAGAEYLGALGDTVWFDTDGDGLQDAGELGVAGVTVTLTGAGDDGVLGTADDTTTVQITDGGGNYLFEDLEAGDYKVTFSDLPAGYVFTTPDAGADDAIDSDAGAGGMTGTITLAAGETNLTVDAGIVDPGTAALSGRYFCDENDNDIDDGEPGVVGVTVTLRKADGTLVATTATLADGSYAFTGLMAGDYVVTFDADPTGKTFVAPNVGSDDTVDSDGVLNSDGTASTGVISLAIGELSEDHDVGVEYVNTPPVAVPDAGKACADEVFSVDLLANDSDADAGDTLSVLTISDADETVGVGGTITLAGGALVTLNADGTVSVDGVAAYADLLIGEQATDGFTYTLSDGAGGSAMAPVDLTFCGAKNTLETIDASLAGATVTYEVRDVTTVAAFAEAYTLDLLSSSSADIPIGAYAAAYCINSDDDFGLGVATTAEVSVATEANATAAGVVNADNIDLVNWILNQDFTAMDNGDGTGDSYTDLEVQEAIWTLLNGDTFFINSPDFPGFVVDDEDGVREAGEIATLENVAEIVNYALNDVDFDGVVDGGADGYSPGEGEIVGLILDPTSPASQVQPFIIGVAFDDLAQDCVCI